MRLAGQAQAARRRKTPPRPARKEEKEGPEPQVDLVFAGEGKARRISAARIEFQDKPVYAGILEHKGIWQDEDASGLAGLQAHAHRLETALRGPLARRLHRRRGPAPGRLAYPQSVVRLQEHQAHCPRDASKLVGAASTDPLDARFAAATSSARPANWWEKGVPWWEQGDENAPQIWQESLASFFIYPAVFKGDEVRLCLYADKNTTRKRSRTSTSA